jgi:aminoglycoside 2''-phosphotransferase
MRVYEYGWANQVVFVGETLIFRFPRSEEALRAMRFEQAILPSLRSYLPVPIPHFLYASQPQDTLSYVGYELLPGQPLTTELFQTLSEEQKEKLARDLGAFLSALHTFDGEKWFADKHTKSYTQQKWQSFYKEIKEKIFPLLTEQEQTWTHTLFTDYLTNPASLNFQPCLLHADFTSDHLLYDFEKGDLSGVIDFGDLEWGDPAYDFVGLYVEYGEAFMKRTLEHYHAPVDPAFIQRIKGFYRQRMPFHGLLHALETNQPKMLQDDLVRLRKMIR